ncbi:MAG: transketolase family protein [Erysipelotrichaceae bacterium]
MTKIATREAYGKALAQLVEKDDHVFVLDADLSGSTKTADARASRPNQHFNMGIAEGNMMGVAAGMATSGNVVFASSFAMFAAGRAFEQIRNSIAYPKLNVKVCATHAGITVGEDGASHQAIEDISLMRSIPNMVVVQPCDATETYAAIDAVYKYYGPCYVRLGRSGVEDISANIKDYKFEIGKGIVLHRGKKVALIATGCMVQQALLAQKELLGAGIDATVVNMHTIKPIDEALLIELAKDHDYFVTCEEHSVIGGLGSAVSEVLSKHAPRKMSMVGVNDTFGESGTPEALLEKYGLNAANIVKTVLESK